MRFEQQIRASLRICGTAALAGALFASGRPVSASGQQGVVTPQQPPAATTQIPPRQIQVTADEAVGLALENNLGIQMQRLEPQIATFGVSEARAAYAPRLFSTTLTRNRTLPPDFLASGGVAGTTTNETVQTNFGLEQNVGWGGGRYSVALDASRIATSSVSSFNPQLGSNLSASYTQPLLRNFRMDSLRQQVLINQKNLEIADVQLRQQVTATSRAVRNAYYDLVGAIGALEVARQSLDIARESLKNNERRVEVGTMAQIDIIEAQAEVSRQEEGVIISESQIRTLEDNLRALVMNPNQPDFWTVQIVPAERPVMTPKAIDVDAAIANALKNRTDLEETRKRMETTDINIKFVQNQKLPAVDVTANYNTVGVGGTQYEFNPGEFPPTIRSRSQRSFTDALRDVFGNEFKTWSVQLNVSYPLGTSAADAALAGARLQKQQEVSNLRLLEMQVTTSVREAARQVNTTLQRVEATKKAREFAERRLEAEQKRMTVGLSTTFQLTQAQRDLASARQSELNAIISYSRALVNFEAVQVAPLR
jgi:outer membrane protein TolC